MSDHRPSARSTECGTSKHLELLQRVTARMTVHHTLGEVLGAITRGLVQNGAAALARIWLYTTEQQCAACRSAASSGVSPQDTHSLHLCASAGIFEGHAGPNHCLPLGMYLGGRVAETRTPTLINDLPGERRVRGLRWISDHGLQAYAGYPLLFDGELQGVLGIFRRKPGRCDEFLAFGIFASQAAIAIKNAALIERTERRSDRLSFENEYLQDEINEAQGSGDIVGTSPPMQALLRNIEKVARTDSTVLLLGETGTGKELVAAAPSTTAPRAATGRSSRSTAAPSRRGLIESELFGHERGAFTGAIEQRLGRFELADGGTLFLDEIGELPLEVQAKLLRVAPGRRVRARRRAGAVRVDVADRRGDEPRPRGRRGDGTFRADLYYRLSVFPLRVPPLRERSTTCRCWWSTSWTRLQRKLGKRARAHAGGRGAPAPLPWPGNVRELQNVLERALRARTGRHRGLVDSLRGERADRAVPHGDAAPARGGRARAHLARAASTHGVIQGPRGAARVLGLHPNTLRSRLERLDILVRNRTDDA